MPLMSWTMLKLKRQQVADLSVVWEVTGSTSTGSFMTMSDLLRLQEEEVMCQEKMNTMGRKLHFLFLVLHVTHMDQNMCRMEADDAEDDVLFLYSTSEQGTTKTTALEKVLNEIKSQKVVLTKRIKTMVIGQQMYRVLNKRK